MWSLADIEHLPAKACTNVLGIRDVLLAIDPEIQLLRDDISQTIKELYIRTTEKAIDRWEKDFSLEFDSALSLEERRQRVINKLARKKTLNWENLGKLIRSNVTKPQYYIINNPAGFSFKILIQDPDTTALDKAIKQAKPAYLLYEIMFTKYERRCGTFNCGTNPI